MERLIKDLITEEATAVSAQYLCFFPVAVVRATEF
jgi:hypothetical protein